MILRTNYICTNVKKNIYILNELKTLLVGDRRQWTGTDETVIGSAFGGIAMVPWGTHLTVVANCVVTTVLARKGEE